MATQQGVAAQLRSSHADSCPGDLGILDEGTSPGLGWYAEDPRGSGQSHLRNAGNELREELRYRYSSVEQAQEASHNGRSLPESRVWEG